jgi:uncharacterized protein (TIGR03435 family)
MPRKLGMLAAMVLAAVHAQEKPARLTFEVASVKLAKAGDPGGGIRALPGGQRYTAQKIPVRLIISLMYKLPLRQITGGPDWLDNEFYNIEAKADHSYSLDELHIMFQNLLADRFGLKFHREYKEGAVYALSVDKGGAKMMVNDSPQSFDFPITGNRADMTGRRVSMEYFCWWLGLQLQKDERPVIDRTGLKGNYDFKLKYLPEFPPDFPKENLPPDMLERPSLFDALKEQLGLKLQAQKGPVEYYVIDHVERPGDN